MADKDVKLVIRARNEASKAIDSVAEALKDLTKAQKQTADTADKTSDLIGDLGSAFDTLKKEAQGLEVLSKVAGAIGKIEAAVSTLEDDVKKSSAALEAHKQELAEATAATAKYEAEAKKVAAALDAEKAATKALRTERTTANRELTKAQAAYDKLNEALQKKPAGAAGKSALAFLAGDVDNAKSKLAEVEKALDSQVRKQNSLKKTLSSVNAEVRSSQTAQAKLADQIERAGAAAKKSEANLADGRKHLTEIKAAATQAATALGGVTVSQEALEAASKQTAEAISRAQAELAAMQRFSDGQGGFTDPKTAAALRQQTAAVTEARQNWELLEARVTLLAEAMRKAAAPTEQMSRELQQARTAAAAARKEFEAQTAALNKMPGAAQNAGRGMRGIFSPIYGESRQAMSMLQRVRGEVLALTTAYLGLYGTIESFRGVLKTYQAMEAAQSRLGVVFQQNGTLIRAEIDWIERQASRLGITFTTLSDSYGKFAVAASKSNFSAQATRDVFLAVAEAGRVNKLSMDDMRGVFVALEQMISKGKVSAEELRQQMGERLPGAFALMARALGKTTAELDKMLELGEVFSNEATMLAFARQLNKEFGSQLARSLSSTTTLMGRFGYELEQAQMRVANGGFIDGFNELLEEMNKWFQSREGRDFFLELGAVAGNFAKALALIPPNIDAITFGVKAFIAVKLAQVLQGVIANLAKTRVEASATVAQFNQATGATNALGAAQTTLGARISAASSSLAALRFALVNTASTMTLAQARTLGLNAGLLAFRTAANAAATAARMLYMAVGGWAGILLTAGSFLATSLLTDWVSGVDEATTAMDEHKRIMGEVIGAYERVGKLTKDWAKEIKNVTEVDAARNFAKRFETYEKSMKDLKKAIIDVAEPMGERWTFGLLRSDAKKKIDDLLASFDGGKLEDFRKKLLDLHGEIEDFEAQKLIQALDEVIVKAMQEERALGEAALAAQAKGVKNELLAKVLKLTGATMESVSQAAEGNKEALDAAAKAVDAYKNALDKVKGMIPELANEMKKLEELRKLDAELDAIGPGPLSPEMQQYANRARQAIEAAYIDTTPLQNSLDTNSAELKKFYEEIKGRANLMSSDPSRWGNPRDRSWQTNFLTSIETQSGQKALVHKSAAAAFQGFINELEQAIGYEIKSLGGWKIRPNTSDPSRLSEHAWGNAIDINPEQNPYLKKLVTDMPDLVGMIAAKYGLSWGGDWKSVKDPMHFEWTGQQAPGAVRATKDELDIQKQKTQELIKQNEELLKGHEHTQKALEDLGFEITQQDLKIAGKDKEAFIEEKIRGLKEGNKNITDEQIAKAKELLGTLYDQEHRLDGVKKAEEEVNRLMQLRKELMEQIEFFENQGEHAKAEQLKTQLEQVNEQLMRAADNAIAMWRAIGGPDAELAIAKLQTTKLQVQDLGNKSQITGKQINDMLADGLTNAFDSFAQAIARGENAVDALWRAFLQFASDFLIQIGKMILKQALLNALQAGGGAGGGVGGFLAAAIGAAFHSGGVVGSGGTPRLVSPGWYANAVKYHQGGIVGLKPGEMPAVLKEGEVVDPGDGSVFNKVFGGAQAQPPVVKIVNAIDSADVVSQGINSAVGEQAVLNFIRANRGAVKEILG